MRYLVLLLAAILAACSSSLATFPKTGCIKHTDEHGIMYERVIVLGENKGNAWEYEIVYPDSNTISTYYIDKGTVQFFGCPGGPGQGWVPPELFLDRGR